MSRLYRRTAGGWAQGGGSPAQNLQVTFQQGSAFFESDRAAREGNLGPTIVPMIIAIPSTGAPGNRALRFRQLDAAGTPIGPDVSPVFPSLAGYTVDTVDLPAGILTPDDVATAYETAANGIYSSVTRAANVVTIGGAEINAAGAFTPSSTTSGGGILGTQDIEGPSDFAQVDSNVCTFQTPTFGGLPAYLWAIQIRTGPVYTDQLRAVLYLGGGINAPVGSTLLHDFGLTPAGATPNEYMTIYCNDLVQLPASSRIQVLLVGAAGTTTEINYQNNAAVAGDYDTSPGGIWQVTGTAIGNNPAVAPPAVFPAGGFNVSATFTFNIRLIYRLAPFFTDGQLRTQYGVHVDATALASRSNFIGNVFTGGNLPPQIEGLGLDYAAIAAETDASFRLAAFQGGVLEQPNSANVLYDFGRGPAGPGLPTDWYQLDVPPAAHVPVSRSSPVWMVGRNQGAGEIAFFFSAGGPGGGTASPDTNPMDWPANTSNPAAGNRPEYETFATNPNFSDDPAVPFESPFVSDASDQLPGNVPGMRLGFRVRPVLLQAV